MHFVHDILVSWGPWALFLLAMLENAGPPTPAVTDYALIFLAAARPSDLMLLAAVAAGGSLIGSVIFYELTRKGGELFLARYTKTGRGKRFRGWFKHYGLVTVFISALVPLPILPFKVFAACAGAMGVTRSRFLLVLALARMPRYLGLAYLGAQLGDNYKVWLKGHFWQLLGLATLLAIVLYALIRWTDHRTRRLASGLQ
jgi:membrane protein YqaA with SNARE-associated domain